MDQRVPLRCRFNWHKWEVTTLMIVGGGVLLAEYKCQRCGTVDWEVVAFSPDLIKAECKKILPTRDDLDEEEALQVLIEESCTCKKGKKVKKAE